MEDWKKREKKKRTEKTRKAATRTEREGEEHFIVL